MSQDWTDNVFQGTHVAQTDMQNVENNLLALLSCFSGSGAPGTSTAGMLYFDSDNGKIYIRDSADANWRCFFDADNNRIETDKVETASIKDDAVTEAKINGLTATFAEVNTACDGSTAKNSHTHTAASLSDVSATGSEINTVCDGSTAKNSHTHTFASTSPPTGIMSYTWGGREDLPSDNTPTFNNFDNHLTTASFYVPSGYTTANFRMRGKSDATRTFYYQLYLNGVADSTRNFSVSGEAGTWDSAFSKTVSAGWNYFILSGGLSTADEMGWGFGMYLS